MASAMNMVGISSPLELKLTYAMNMETIFYFRNVKAGPKTLNYVLQNTPVILNQLFYIIIFL